MIIPNSTFFPLAGSNSNIISVDHHLHHHLTSNYPFDQHQSYSSNNSFLGFDQFFDDHHHQHNNNNNIHGLGFDDHRYNYPPQNDIISTDQADSISSFTASAPLMPEQTPLSTTTTTTTSHHHHHHDMASCSTGSSASTSSVDWMSMNKYHIKMKCKEEINKSKREEGKVVAFRTETELETLADGYKWRKYGKKMVKSNPNPRNYYKCSSVGCKVKKRIERDGEDSRYLITTYEGIHNHQSPCGIIYYDKLPFSLSNGWSNQLQPI